MTKKQKQIPKFVGFFDAEDKHTRRSTGGHWFEKHVCQRCGVTLEEFKTDSCQSQRK